MARIPRIHKNTALRTMKESLNPAESCHLVVPSFVCLGCNLVGTRFVEDFAFFTHHTLGWKNYRVDCSTSITHFLHWRFFSCLFDFDHPSSLTVVVCIDYSYVEVRIFACSPKTPGANVKMCVISSVGRPAKEKSVVGWRGGSSRFGFKMFHDVVSRNDEFVFIAFHLYIKLLTKISTDYKI